MKTRQEVREWAANQFYSDADEQEPCQDYENWPIEDIEEEIDRMTDSLCRKLGVKE